MTMPRVVIPCLVLLLSLAHCIDARSTDEYPLLAPLLRLGPHSNGTAVQSQETWQNERRPEVSKLIQEAYAPSCLLRLQ